MLAKTSFTELTPGLPGVYTLPLHDLIVTYCCYCRCVVVVPRAPLYRHLSYRCISVATHPRIKCGAGYFPLPWKLEGNKLLEILSKGGIDQTPVGDEGGDQFMGGYVEGRAVSLGAFGGNRYTAE